MSHHYAVRINPVVGGIVGGGLGKDIGYGVRVGGTAEVGLLSPLWLSASAFYAMAPGGSGLHADVLTGFNFVRWGTRWVEAGAASAGGVATAWNSHCQVRRNEFALMVGGKFIVAHQTLTALQAGLGETFKRDGGYTRWRLTGLYDPAHPSYGGQLDLGVAGGFLPYPVWFGTNLGGVTGDRKAWWMTLDLGVAFEI